jgi:hypothetical protein
MKRYLFLIEIYRDGESLSVTLEGESLDDPILRKKLANFICSINDGDTFNWVDHESDEDLEKSGRLVKAYEIEGEPLDVPYILLDVKNLNIEINEEYKERQRKQDEDRERSQLERLKEKYENEIK